MAGGAEIFLIFLRATEKGEERRPDGSLGSKVDFKFTYYYKNP